MGWRVRSETITGFLGYTLTPAPCRQGIPTPQSYTYTNFVYYDPHGGTHTFPGFQLYDSSQCPSGQHASGTTTATDGSALYLSANTSGVPQIPLFATITLPSGTVITPFNGPYSYPVTGAGTVMDTNGNTITVSSTTVTDTLNTAALTFTNPGVYTYPGPSTNESVTVNSSPATVQTSFGCANEQAPYSTSLVSSILLPDGSTYLFTYEPTPGYPANTTGRIQSVTLPTGGTIHYTYGSFVCNLGRPYLSGLTRQTPDGTWTYALSHPGTVYWTTTITAPQDPQGQHPKTVISFVGTSVGIYETQRMVYADTNSTTPLVTVDTCYNGHTSPCPQDPTNITTPFTQIQVTNTLAGAQPSRTLTLYESHSLPTEVDEYDFGPTLVRKTLTSYATNLGLIADRPLTVIVKDGSNNLVAQTTNSYDSHGNVLSEQHSGPNTTTISRTFTYLPSPSNGVIQTSTDFNSHTTTYHYSSGSCNNAFPTSVSLPASLSRSMTWDCNGAVLTSLTDENQQLTNFQHNDPFWRLTATGYPDGGSKNIYYTSPTLLDVYTALSSSTTRHDQTSLDSLGRVNAQSLLGTNNSVISEVDTTYDALGRVHSVSNPHAGTGSPSDGLTYYSYDALGRLSDEGTAKSILRPDGNTVSTSYSANCVTLTDEQSKVRENCYDALGHLKQVFEDPNGSNFLTTYSYDTLGNLTGVSQNAGQQTRSYYYDAFSRLTRAVTPEAAYNSTYFYYTTSGGALCSGDPNAPCRRTDARNITTTYSYDALSRLTSKTFSDGTPTASFLYDQTPSGGSWPAWSGVSFGYPKGRLILACTNSPAGTCTSPQTAVAYSYDTVGRPTGYWQCTPYNCGSASIWSMPYSYDLAGDVHSWTHPAGSPTITNSIIDVAQRTTQISSNLVDSTHPGNLAQTITYTPWGAVHTIENGCAGSGCTNMRETDTYNNRLQPVMIELQKTSDNSHNYCLVYNYYSGFGNPTGCAVPSQATTGNNGNVAGYWYNDNVNSSQSHTAAYAYDNVNRLSTAATTTNSLNLTFNYDRYGNMACTLNGQTNGPCPQWTFNTATNRITTSGFTYDAAGNLTGDGTYTYQWDAEGRLISVNNGAYRSYVYNALGREVEWHGDGRVAEDLTDLAGHYLGGVDPSSGAWTGERIPGGKIYLAWYVNGGTTFFHYNALGSTVMNTRQDGNTVSNDILFYPWGQVWASPVNDYFQFFGNIEGWDWEEGKGVTLNRYYPNTQGRWLSPDPLAGDTSNPQSLNRYAYVLNNPTSLTDPTGLSENAYGHGFGGGMFSIDPEDYCARLYSNDASCSQAAGLWDNGQPIYGGGGVSASGWGGGGGGGVWNEVAPPFGGGAAGPPCEFGDCRTQPQTPFVSDVRAMNGEFWMFAHVWWPFLGPPSDPGMRALWNAGNMSAPVASPWAPVAWYGASAAMAVSPALPAGVKAVFTFAANNPITWKCATSFAFNLFSPLIPFQPDTDEYPCGSAGQMASAIVWSISHPKGH